MRRVRLFLLACGVLALASLTLPATAQNGPPPGPGGGKARPDGPPPGGFHLLPRFVADRLELTADQQQKIAALEKETKAKLDQILSAEQKKILDEARPPRRGDGPPPGGPENGGGGPGGHRPPPPPNPGN